MLSGVNKIYMNGWNKIENKILVDYDFVYTSEENAKPLEKQFFEDISFLH